MRSLTNKANLPQAIVDAVKNDSYSKGDSSISVTGLLKPPRIAVLEEKNEDKIVEDVSDRIWSLLGQSIHTILERANRTAVAERRLSMEIEGWTVSGGMDLYEENGTLNDYKMTSVWKLVKGDLDEWEKQLNLYSVILRHHGHKVQKLQAIAILRDWSKKEAARDIGYPQAQIVNINMPLWSEEKALKFMRERIVLHKQARLSLPLCTPRDRWAKSDVFAVMKKGRKKAVNLYNDESEAKAHVGFDKDLSVTHRKGFDVRCAAYCNVAKFCTQYQESLTQSERPADEINEIKEVTNQTEISQMFSRMMYGKGVKS